MNKVILADSAGFCFGVQRAVDEAIKVQKQYDKKIYTLGPLIHNNDVVNYLQENNIHVIDFDNAMKLEKGDELGRFYLGSTAVVLFEKDKMQWDQAFKANSTVVMGEALGHLI